MSLVSGQDDSDLILNYDTATKFAQLPLECYNQAYPHKFGLAYDSALDLKDPDVIHPIFYGCFDWHSSVHGHWLLSAVRNKFNGSPLADEIEKLFDEQFQGDKVVKELKVFDLDKLFERTYGWAWLLKLQQELMADEYKQEWANSLEPLAARLVKEYVSFLPALSYPIRVGEHSNTAFGLIFALEYAQISNDKTLVDLIKFNSTNHFGRDTECPLNWEPSGQDFLSPCLQEADLIGRIMEKDKFTDWLKKFLPQLFNESFQLEPGQVIDETDGKLVHLHGVNFSRAWNLYSIMLRLGDKHHEDK